MPEKFICLDYQKFQYLIPYSEVTDSFCCSEKNYVSGNKVSYLNREFTCIDFDDSIYSYFTDEIDIDFFSANIKTAICLKNHNENSENNYALVTTANCRVKEYSRSCFFDFGPVFSSHLNENGILSIGFENDCALYVLDIFVIYKNINKGLIK